MLSKEEREHARKVATEWGPMRKRDGDPLDAAILLAEALLDQEDELGMAYDVIFTRVPESMPIHKKIEALIEEYDLMKAVVDAAIGGQSALGKLYKSMTAYIALKGP